MMIQTTNCELCKQEFPEQDVYKRKFFDKRGRIKLTSQSEMCDGCALLTELMINPRQPDTK